MVTFCGYFILLVTLGKNPDHANPLNEIDPHFGYGNEKDQMKCVFINLLNVLDSIVLPESIAQHKSKLTNLVLTDQIDVLPIIKYLKKYNILSKFDMMVAALLTLRDTLPDYCPVGDDIRHLILFSIFNKFLLDNNPLEREEVCRKLVEFSQPHVSCNCEAIRYIDSLQHQLCQVHKSEGLDLITERILPQEHSIDFDYLFSLLPKPKTDEEMESFNSLKVYIHGPEQEEFFKTIDEPKLKDDYGLLESVLHFVVDSNSNTQLKQAAVYYLKFIEAERMHKPLFNYSIVMEYFPQPINDEEINLYATIKKFLSSTAIHYYLPQFNDNVYTNGKLLYKQILVSLRNNSELDPNITKAFQYYSDYEEGLDDVPLHASRIQEKSFNLKNVFNDTLNNLDPKLKANVKLLLRFVAKYPYTMKEFKISGDVRTQAELANAILTFLSKSSNVPETLKMGILELIQHITDTGRGADLI